MSFALIALPFACAQGLVVFLTAYAFWRWRGLRNGWWKPPLMTASWLAWCVLTIAGYAAIGGEGGLMDGFGLVLILCFTALFGSLVFLIGWLLA